MRKMSVKCGENIGQGEYVRACVAGSPLRQGEIMLSRKETVPCCLVTSRTMRSREHHGAGRHAGTVAIGLSQNRRRLARDRRLVDGGDALDGIAVGGDELSVLRRRRGRLELSALEEISASFRRRPSYVRR